MMLPWFSGQRVNVHLHFLGQQWESGETFGTAAVPEVCEAWSEIHFEQELICHVHCFIPVVFQGFSVFILSFSCLLSTRSWLLALSLPSLCV